MMESTCSMDIEQVPGLKNKILGGEGFFNTVITGPGHIILQTITIPRIARSLMQYIPSRS
jgi:uncharacterized protein (AIM24 family)